MKISRSYSCHAVNSLRETIIKEVMRIYVYGIKLNKTLLSFCYRCASKSPWHRSYKTTRMSSSLSWQLHRPCSVSAGPWLRKRRSNQQDWLQWPQGRDVTGMQHSVVWLTSTWMGVRLTGTTRLETVRNGWSSLATPGNYSHSGIVIHVMRYLVCHISFTEQTHLWRIGNMPIMRIDHNY